MSSVVSDRRLLIIRLGEVPYADALALQRTAARAVISGDISADILLLTEHPPVITAGRSAKAANLIASQSLLSARGVEHFEVERGGDVTFHGPGQLVGYPIIDLKCHRQDLHWYLRQLEASLLLTLATHGVVGERRPGQTGVWVSNVDRAGGGAAGGAESTPRKIASIGVHARDWVTWHGFALNVTTDLSYFDLIVPCGIPGVIMTSMAAEAGSDSLSVNIVAPHAAESLSAVFGLRPASATRSELAAIGVCDGHLRQVTSGDVGAH